MKTLFTTLIFLALLNTACKKSNDFEEALANVQFKKTASIKAPVNGINGFTVNGTAFAVNAVGTSYGFLQQQTWFSSGQGATLRCITRFPFPETDGTFRYKLSIDVMKSLNMQISCFLVDGGENYDLFVADNYSYATLQVANGRFSLNIPELQLDARDGSGKFIIISCSLSSSVSQVHVIDGPISNPSNSTLTHNHTF